ncbi:PolC-type DNA polymerase III, partial [Chloroflexota bacterium]
MERIYVALDLETTGLSPETDDIIEVAAIKFDGQGIIDTFNSLVNPGRSLPYRVQRLCGITQAEVNASPPFTEIAVPFSNFIGADAIVGHNLYFDLAFLRQKGLDFLNTTYDTWEMAGILALGAPDLSLSSVADHLGVSYSERHRALADAVLAEEA